MPRRLTLDQRRLRRRAVLRAAAAGLVTTILLLLLKAGAERFAYVRQFMLMTYDLQQMSLGPAHGDKVVVVDISDIPRVRRSLFDDDGYTSRDEILKLVLAVAKQEPCAIAVDVDMSPNERGYIDPLDPMFFRNLLSTWRLTGIPIVVGVDRTTGDGPERWLGNEEFAPLAAAMVIPKDTRYMPKLLFMYSKDDSDHAGATFVERALHESAHDYRGLERSPSGCPRVPLSDVSASAPLPSLSHALTRGSLQQTPGWLETWPLRWLFEPSAIRRVSPQSPAWVGEFLVDYGGTLDALQRPLVGTIDWGAIDKRPLSGKFVVLGRASAATDRFPVPGRREQPSVEGVYLHASAAQTLLDSPLIQPTHGGRIAIDLVLSVGIITLIGLVQLTYAATRDAVRTDRLHRLLTAGAVLLVIGIAFTFASQLRIMWEDALLVVAVLVIHRAAERNLERLAHHGPAALRRTWRAVFIQREGKAHQ